MPSLGNLCAALLLALALAGCSGSPPPAAPSGSQETSAPAATPPGDRTSAPAAASLTLGDCVGIETVTPMPMQDALPLLPPGYLPIPFQAFFGAPSAQPHDPSAALFTLSFACGTASGAANATGAQIAYVGVIVQAPANVTAGTDVAMLDVVASDPAVAALYAGAGFRVQPGQVAFSATATGPLVHASVTVGGSSLSFTQSVAAPTGARREGFEGRFFAVKDGKASGAADFRIPDGVTFDEGAGAVQATQGSLAGQAAGSGFADSFALPTFVLTFHGLPLPPAPQA